VGVGYLGRKSVEDRNERVPCKDGLLCLVVSFSKNKIK
jgi:hypothetical protein